MRDNHTFIKPKENTLKEIKDDFLRIAKENPYGMVCRPIVMKGENEIMRIGISQQVDGKGNVELEKWYDFIKDNKVINNYFNKQ